MYSFMVPLTEELIYLSLWLNRYPPRRHHLGDSCILCSCLELIATLESHRVAIASLSSTILLPLSSRHPRLSHFLLNTLLMHLSTLHPSWILAYLHCREGLYCYILIAISFLYALLPILCKLESLSIVLYIGFYCLYSWNIVITWHNIYWPLLPYFHSYWPALLVVVLLWLSSSHHVVIAPLLLIITLSWLSLVIYWPLL